MNAKVPPGLTIPIHFVAILVGVGIVVSASLDPPLYGDCPVGRYEVLGVYLGENFVVQYYRGCRYADYAFEVFALLNFAGFYLIANGSKVLVRVFNEEFRA